MSIQKSYRTGTNLTLSIHDFGRYGPGARRRRSASAAGVAPTDRRGACRIASIGRGAPPYRAGCHRSRRGDVSVRGDGRHVIDGEGPAGLCRDEGMNQPPSTSSSRSSAPMPSGSASGSPPNKRLFMSTARRRLFYYGVSTSSFICFDRTNAKSCRDLGKREASS
jgi:hypothetical protein